MSKVASEKCEKSRACVRRVTYLASADDEIRDCCSAPRRLRSAATGTGRKSCFSARSAAGHYVTKAGERGDRRLDGQREEGRLLREAGERRGVARAGAANRAAQPAAVARAGGDPVAAGRLRAGGEPGGAL